MHGRVVLVNGFQHSLNCQIKYTTLFLSTSVQFKSKPIFSIPSVLAHDTATNTE